MQENTKQPMENNKLKKQEIQINPCKKTPNNRWKTWNLKACTKHIYKTANNQFGNLDKVFKTNMRHNFSGKICPRKGSEQ